MRLFLFADEPILSEALRFTFSQTDDIQLERILNAAEDILPAVQEGKPDLLLLCLTPTLHLNTLLHLRDKVPDCRVVLWVRSSSLEISHQAMELGVRGILPRTCSMELMLKCLRKIHEGELWFDRHITASHMTCHRVTLTPRQAQLAQLVAEGRKNKEIAADLAISEGAVKVYLSHLFDKVGTRDRNELAQLVIRNFQSVEHMDQSTRAPGAELRVLYVDSPEQEAPGTGPKLRFRGGFA